VIFLGRRIQREKRPQKGEKKLKKQAKIDKLAMRIQNLKRAKEFDAAYTLEIQLLEKLIQKNVRRRRVLEKHGDSTREMDKLLIGQRTKREKLKKLLGERREKT